MPEGPDRPPARAKGGRRRYAIDPVNGYSIQEAAEVLGVPKRRVRELVARGVILGSQEDDGELRVFLQPRPPASVQAPAEPEPGFEASPFRELLTEFRNLTERYGQALLALGESRGEVAALRGRVDALETRMDLRLGSSATPPVVEWHAPAPTFEAETIADLLMEDTSAEEIVIAEAEAALASTPAATDETLVAEPTEAQPAVAEEEPASKTPEPAVAAEAGSEPEPEPAGEADAVTPAADATLDVTADQGEIPEIALAEVGFETAEGPSGDVEAASEQEDGEAKRARPRRTGFPAADIAEALARAMDPSPGELPEPVDIASAADTDEQGATLDDEGAVADAGPPIDASRYSAEIEEPDWMAEGEYTWLDAGAQETAPAPEPASQAAVEREAFEATPSDGDDVVEQSEAGGDQDWDTAAVAAAEEVGSEPESVMAEAEPAATGGEATTDEPEAYAPMSEEFVAAPAPSAVESDDVESEDISAAPDELAPADESPEADIQSAFEPVDLEAEPDAAAATGDRGAEEIDVAPEPVAPEWSVLESPTEASIAAADRRDEAASLAAPRFEAPTWDDDWAAGAGPYAFERISDQAAFQDASRVGDDAEASEPQLIAAAWEPNVAAPERESVAEPEVDADRAGEMELEQSSSTQAAREPQAEPSLPASGPASPASEAVAPSPAHQAGQDDTGEVALMWLGSEFDDGDDYAAEIEVGTAGWRQPKRPPGSSDELTRIAQDQGWDQNEVAAIRSLLEPSAPEGDPGAGSATEDRAAAPSEATAPARQLRRARRLHWHRSSRHPPTNGARPMRTELHSRRRARRRGRRQIVRSASCCQAVMSCTARSRRSASRRPPVAGRRSRRQTAARGRLGRGCPPPQCPRPRLWSPRQLPSRARGPLSRASGRRSAPQSSHLRLHSKRRARRDRDHRRVPSRLRDLRPHSSRAPRRSRTRRARHRSANRSGCAAGATLLPAPTAACAASSRADVRSADGAAACSPRQCLDRVRGVVRPWRRRGGLARSRPRCRSSR